MKKLLIVDDSELIRSRLADMLRGRPGVDSVDAVGNLSQALDYMLDCPPDLAILDLHLPDGNALQILGVFKRIAPVMPIVILTNDAGEFNRTRCLEAGADAFFDKSNEFETAMAWVQRQTAGGVAVSDRKAGPNAARVEKSAVAGGSKVQADQLVQSVNIFKQGKDSS